MLHIINLILLSVKFKICTGLVKESIVYKHTNEMIHAGKQPSFQIYYVDLETVTK